MTLPTPTDPLVGGVRLKVLPAGTILHRIHAAVISGVSAPSTAFNPGLGRPARFSPISNGKGNPIPTMYLAETFETAVFETIFHEVPVTTNALLKTVKKQDIDDRAYSRLSLTMPVSVATLSAPDLKRWGVTRADLLESEAICYLDTARWAEAVWKTDPLAAGLEWTSKQADDGKAFMFFGDRVPAAALQLVDVVNVATSRSLLSEIRAAGKRAGIMISV